MGWTLRSSHTTHLKRVGTSLFLHSQQRKGAAVLSCNSGMGFLFVSRGWISGPSRHRISVELVPLHFQLTFSRYQGGANSWSCLGLVVFWCPLHFGVKHRTATSLVEFNCRECLDLGVVYKLIHFSHLNLLLN